MAIAHTTRQERVTDSSQASVAHTTVAIAGGGPAGAVLALLLARKGIAVTLLEAHTDFDREFRGDTIHPATMELMDALGLAERLLQLRHTKVRSYSIPSAAGPLTIADFNRLKTPYPFITILPQPQFLELVTGEAQRYPTFRLVMGARVEQLIEEHGAIRGVRYRGGDGWHELRALLTVGADGRFSRVRRLAGCEPLMRETPLDVLWFRLPRRESDPQGLIGGYGDGHAVTMLDRTDHWQIAYLIQKGSFQRIRAAGIEALQRSLVQIVPLLADRVTALRDWKQISLLSVEAGRVRQWYRQGLLLIGDAAHVMSPVGGVGINYAVQDAVVAANELSEPLRRGRLLTEHLAAVQRQRELPIRAIQAFQSLMERRLAASLFHGRGATRPPLLLRLLPRVPVLRGLLPRIVGFGLGRVRLKS